MALGKMQPLSAGAWGMEGGADVPRWELEDPELKVGGTCASSRRRGITGISPLRKVYPRACTEAAHPRVRWGGRRHGGSTPPQEGCFSQSGAACEQAEVEAVRLANEMQAEYWSVSAKTGEWVRGVAPAGAGSFLRWLYGMLESQPPVLVTMQGLPLPERSLLISGGRAGAVPHGQQE